MAEVTCTAEWLVEAAKCYACLTGEMADAVEVYLLCQWANQV